MIRNIFSLLTLFYFFSTHAQTPIDASILINATIGSDGSSLELNWPQNPFASGYTLYKKEVDAVDWGDALAVLGPNENSYIDDNVDPKSFYEYKISMDGSIQSFGYITAGILVSYENTRDKLILIIDNTFSEDLIVEIKTLINDLEGDGYTVIRHDVSREETVSNIKSIISEDYNADPENVKSVFLLGHIPVPYSGNINPDGHPEHKGAWPADVYYADMDGNWTDDVINSTTAAFDRNKNIPGDGKFDQSTIPSLLELEIGRVDFFDLPSFVATEKELMKGYLNKNHDYRTKIYSPAKRALIEDNFGFFSGEAFAAGAWRNFSSLVGNQNIQIGDFTTGLTNDSFLWAYGCGPGSYNAAAEIATTEQLAVSQLNATFTMLFGSYFGDWDNSNNFMRSILAQGKTLSCSWSGRPHWSLHPMAMGKSLGYCTKLTQNNLDTYDYGYGANFVHVALIGDPSLKNDVVAPISNLSLALNENNCTLNWSASPDNIVGYNVFRKLMPDGRFVRLNIDPITQTTYIDSCLLNVGTYKYMVRAQGLIASAAGSYYLNSCGISDTIVLNDIVLPLADATFENAGLELHFVNNSQNATSYLWTFSNGTTSSEVSPFASFQETTFTATLIASNYCTSDTLEITGQFPLGMNDFSTANIYIYPNPVEEILNIEISNSALKINTIEIYDLMGKLVMKKEIELRKFSLDISELSSGIYTVKSIIENKSIYSKVLVTK